MLERYRAVPLAGLIDLFHADVILDDGHPTLAVGRQYQSAQAIKAKLPLIAGLPPKSGPRNR